MWRLRPQSAPRSCQELLILTGPNNRGYPRRAATFPPDYRGSTEVQSPLYVQLFASDFPRPRNVSLFSSKNNPGSEAFHLDTPNLYGVNVPRTRSNVPRLGHGTETRYSTRTFAHICKFPTINLITRALERHSFLICFIVPWVLMVQDGLHHLFSRAILKRCTTIF